MIGLPPTFIRVRYSDVDRTGFLYHVNYLEYFEVARSDWIRRFWRPYKEIEDAGYALVVIEARLKYLKPARYDDELEVHADLAGWGRSRIEFNYRIQLRGGDVLICTGQTTHCFIDRSGTPTGMPGELRALLDSHRTEGT